MKVDIGPVTRLEGHLSIQTTVENNIITEAVSRGEMFRGFEVCRQLKSNNGTSNIKIVAISGYEDQKNRDRILSCGADRFFEKPVDMKVIISEIHKLIRSEDM